MTAGPRISPLSLIERLDWQRIAAGLDGSGYALIDGILDADACVEIAAWYEDDSLFRSRVVMASHGFGRGEYQYFAYPLPEPIASLRQALYPPLATIANDWNSRLGLDALLPDGLDAYLQRCHAAGQTKPTPLLLRYEAGDFNCLHQDLYGQLTFPLQVTFLLSDPQRDFSGGEFVLTQQRPRMQSRVDVVPLRRGDAVIFPVNQRPVQGSRGVYRVTMRHGVSEVRNGHRRTLGIIFHDAA